MGLVCPMCNYDGQWASHIQKGLWGDGIECIKCHNYILYVSPENQIWKDEIYLEEGRYLIRDIVSNETTLFSKGKIVCEVNHIIQFQSLTQLANKIKTMMVFS